MTQRRIVVAAFIAHAALGCTDTPAAPTRSAEVPRYSATTRLRATVDAEAGTLTFAPVPLFGGMPIGAAAIAPQIYGDQGTTVQLYNSVVTITNPSSPGKKTFSANVGLRNRLSHPIGDEQNSLAPLDTIGIYVFVNAGPTVAALRRPVPRGPLP